LVVNKPFLPTMPPLLLGKTGLDTDEFAALLGVPWEAFSTVKRARRLTVAEQRRFTDLRDRLEHGELAEMKSSARRPILLAEIVGEITRAQPQPPPKQLPLQPPKQPPNPSPGQRAVMLRKFLNIKWATLAEVTGIPVDALRTASARTQLNEASAARLTALADLTVTHPKANEFRAALAELPEPKPVTQPVPAYVPIVRKHGPNSPAATLEEMAQRYGVEVRAATQWMRVHGGTGGPRRPRAGHLLRLDALGDGAAAEIDSATVHLPLEMLDALGDDAVEIGGHRVHPGGVAGPRVETGPDQADVGGTARGTRPPDVCGTAEGCVVPVVGVGDGGGSCRGGGDCRGLGRTSATRAETPAETRMSVRCW